MPADEEYGEGSCCLGNVNTTKFVNNPFNTNPSCWKDNFDWTGYAETLTSAVRFLDDVLDVSKYPYESNKKIAHNDRRIGLNHISGIGSTLAMLKIPYDSPLAVEVTSELSKFARDVAITASIGLAIEKGAFPNFNYDKYSKGGFFKTLPEKLQKEIKKHGIRNCAIGSIPPAGTGSLLMNNISNGIEPFFMTEYNRNIRQPGGSTITEAVEDYAWSMYKKIGKPDGDKPDYFRSAREISVEAHLNIQAAAQKYIAGNISKTVNLPESCTLEDYMKYMRMSWELECRGFTSFREGTRQGVLESKDEKKSQDVKMESSKIVRPYVVDGKTYQLKDDTSKRVYCTINHIDQDGDKKPWEVFLYSKSAHSEWYSALGVLLSAIMRKVKAPDFLNSVLQDLKEIDGDNGYFTQEHGYMRSKIQHVACVIEKHIDDLQGKEKIVEYSICPDCKEKTYVHEGGCGHCLSCNYSTCG